MSDMSTYLGNKVLRWMAGNAFPSVPALYLALFNGDPKSTGTEVSEDVIYTGRQLITLEAIADGTDNSVASDADVDFGNAENAVTMTHVAVYDDPTAGNLLWSKEIPGGPYAITIGMPVKFPSGGIVFNCGD